MDDEKQEAVEGNSSRALVCQGLRSPTPGTQHLTIEEPSTGLQASSSSGSRGRSIQTIDTRTDTLPLTIAPHVRRGLFDLSVNPSLPNLHAISSGDASSDSEDMDPALTTIWDGGIINEDNFQTGTTSAESTSTRRFSLRPSAPDVSEPTRVGRKVIVTSEADEASWMAAPTPLGFTRRMSIYERANSSLLIQPSNGVGSLGNFPRASSRVSGGILAAMGPDGDSVAAEECVSGSEVAPITEEKYNVIYRDWLMHVLEKDDQLDTQVVLRLFVLLLRSGLMTCTIQK